MVGVHYADTHKRDAEDRKLLNRVSSQEPKETSKTLSYKNEAQAQPQLQVHIDSPQTTD